jgi:hypothetical protein
MASRTFGDTIVQQVGPYSGVVVEEGLGVRLSPQDIQWAVQEIKASAMEEDQQSIEGVLLWMEQKGASQAMLDNWLEKALSFMPMHR